MSTQVATSHTQLHTRAPLTVPKRPPRNDVTVAIQKFLPYVVVFLLSLVVYNTFKSSQVSYPPYSPPNMGSEQLQTQPVSKQYEHMLNFAKDSINRRNQRLEELKRKSAEQEDDTAKLGQWKVWREKKEVELKDKIEQANTQASQGLNNRVRDAVADLNKKVAEAKEEVHDIKIKGEDFLGQKVDAAEQMMADAKTMGSAKLAETKDYAYDALYSWKQKAGEMKDTAQETLSKAADMGKETTEKVADTLKTVVEGAKDMKEPALDTADMLKEKAQEVIENAKDTIINTAEKTQETLTNVVGQENIDMAKEKLNEAKDAALEWADSGLKTAEKAQEMIANAKGTVEEKATEVIENARDTVQETYENARETLMQARATENKKGRISQAAYDHARRVQDSSSSMIDRLSGLIERVKAGLVADEEVRKFTAMQEELTKVDFNQKTDMVVRQLQLLGDDVVQEVIRKLGGGQKVCPK